MPKRRRRHCFFSGPDWRDYEVNHEEFLENPPSLERPV